MQSTRKCGTHVRVFRSGGKALSICQSAASTDETLKPPGSQHFRQLIHYALFTRSACGPLGVTKVVYMSKESLWSEGQIRSGSVPDIKVRPILSPSVPMSPCPQAILRSRSNREILCGGFLCIPGLGTRRPHWATHTGYRVVPMSRMPPTLSSTRHLTAARETVKSDEAHTQHVGTSMLGLDTVVTVGE